MEMTLQHLLQEVQNERSEGEEQENTEQRGSALLLWLMNPTVANPLAPGSRKSAWSSTQIRK